MQVPTNSASRDHAEPARLASPLARRSTSGNDANLSGVLWRRKGTLIFSMLAGLAGGYFHFTQQPETYTAESVISVFQPRTATGTDSAVEKIVDTAPGVSQIQAEMTSDSVLMSAIETAQLTSFDGAPADVAALSSWMRNGLHFVVPKDSGGGRSRSVVQVIFDSPNPMLSTAVVNAVVGAYEDHLNGRHRDAVNTVVGFFREARDTLMPQLNELEQQYAAFRSTAPLEWSSSGEAVNPFRQDALTIEDALRKTRTESRQIDSKLRLIQDATRDQTSAILALRDLQFMLEDVKVLGPGEEGIVLEAQVDPEILIKEQLVPKVIQSDLLKRTLGDNHPLRVELEEEIEATRRALTDLDRARQERATDLSMFSAKREEEAKNLLRSYISGLRKKQELLKEDTTELEARLAETRSRAHNMMKFENENLSYNRRIGRLQAMLDSFDSQLEKSSLPLMNPGLEVEVLHRSGMGGKTGPLLPRSLMLGVLVGTAIGCALSWLIDWSERTYRSPEEITSTLALPVLAHLPVMLIRKKKKSRRNKGDGTDPLDQVAPSISVVHEPHSPTSEAIRGIRTGLLCAKTERTDFQVIQVTSSLPGDGKSTLAANLAASIARAQKRVIIVDADLRRPTQHTLFGNATQATALGLTSVLNDEISLAEAILSTGIEGLDLLPTGPIPNNPAEAVMLPEFGQVLDDLRSEYDLIIVDSPPLLACTDASNISSQVDGVLFVMRIGRNSKPYSQRATQILKSLRVNVIGIIVNAVGDSSYSATYASSWSSNYGYYGSDYSYGYDQSVSDKYLGASKSRTVTVQGKGRQPMELAAKVTVGADFAPDGVDK